jgi:hypothetical protein
MTGSRSEPAPIPRLHQIGRSFWFTSSTWMPRTRRSHALVAPARTKPHRHGHSQGDSRNGSSMNSDVKGRYISWPIKTQIHSRSVRQFGGSLVRTGMPGGTARCHGKPLLTPRFGHCLLRRRLYRHSKARLCHRLQPLPPDQHRHRGREHIASVRAIGCRFFR